MPVTTAVSPWTLTSVLVSVSDLSLKVLNSSFISALFPDHSVLISAGVIVGQNAIKRPHIAVQPRGAKLFLDAHHLELIGAQGRRWPGKVHLRIGRHCHESDQKQR